MVNWKPRGVEMGKNLLILLLTLSAVALAGRALRYSSPAPGGLLGGFLPSATPTAPPVTDSLGQGGVHRPVRMALMNENGRYATQYSDGETDGLFDYLGPLLGEALGSASPPQPTTRAEWMQALGRIGIYFDFLGPNSLPLLATWLSGETAVTTLTGLSAKLLLAQEPNGDAVRLYYLDAETGSYYSCSTSVQFRDLIGNYSPNGATFAFESTHYSWLAPDVLFLPEPPAPPLYTADGAIDFSNPTARQSFLAALDFFPSSNAIYPTADGWRVLDGTDSLRLSPDGTVTYHSGEGEARYPLPPNASLAEQLETAGRLVGQAMAPHSGSARIYLSGLTTSEDSVTLTYSYSLSGAEVQLDPEGWCASFTLADGQITDYTLRLRRYSPTTESAVLLPEYQAMAAMDALDARGRFLSLSYFDNGNPQVVPTWIAR